MIFEVFRQERKGQPFQHAGSVEAANREFADVYAREQYGRRGESEALWIAPRSAIHAIEEFVDELGLTVPDTKLRRRDDGVWEYSEPDWDELRSVVTGHGPRSQDRLAFRRRFLEQEKWVRETVLAA